MTFVAGGRRVVVTGLGAVTPLGTDVPTYWRRLVAGESGVGPITSFDPADVASKIAGEVTDFDPSSALDRKEVRRNDRTTQMALVSVREAVSDASLPERFEGQLGEATGVLMASGLGGTNTLIEQIATSRIEGMNRVSPFFIPMAIANMPSGMVGIMLGALGPNYSTTSACASSGHAIGEAYEIIKRGDAEVMIAGGCEGPIADSTVAGFARMKALSTRNDDPERASRPFDADRDGFVMGEGSGVLILEDYERAKARGVRIYSEVMGAGLTADAYHITAPDPEGRGASLAMKNALAEGGIAPENVTYVNAHGTSTPYNDRTESLALRKFFGDHASQLKISSTKSMTGHLLGAAGGLESAITSLAIARSKMPPTINQVTADPDCDLDYIPNRYQEGEVEFAISTSLGFGGHNIVLLLGADPARR